MTNSSNSSPVSPTGRAPSTTLGAKLLIRGELRGEEGVTLEGRVEGTIDLKGHLHVAEGGVVAASVHVSELTVAGTIQGDITATQRVAVHATGRVVGDIQAPRIVIADGAVVQGALDMTTPVAGDSARKEPPRHDGARTEAPRSDAARPSREAAGRRGSPATASPPASVVNPPTPVVSAPTPAANGSDRSTATAVVSTAASDEPDNGGMEATLDEHGLPAPVAILGKRNVARHG
jgi:cytoskeletal protein CcmA (bactofilin family)